MLNLIAAVTSAWFVGWLKGQSDIPAIVGKQACDVYQKAFWCTNVYSELEAIIRVVVKHRQLDDVKYGFDLEDGSVLIGWSSRNVVLSIRPNHWNLTTAESLTEWHSSNGTILSGTRASWSNYEVEEVHDTPVECLMAALAIA
jgi:hypothetical protein